MSGPVDPPADRPQDDAFGADSATTEPPPPPPPPGQGYPGQQPYGDQYSGQPQYGQPQYGQPQYGGPPVQQGNGPATAGLVLGILGVVLAFIPFLGVVLGGLFGLLAAIFGGVGLSRSKQPYRGGKGMAIAGLVLGIIALILAVLQATFWGAVGEAANDPGVQQELEELERQIEEDLEDV